MKSEMLGLVCVTVFCVLADQAVADTVAYYDFETAGYGGTFYSVPDVSGNVLNLVRKNVNRSLVKNSDIAAFVNAGSNSGYAASAAVYAVDSSPMFQMTSADSMTLEGFLKIDSSVVPASETQMIPYSLYTKGASGYWTVYLNREDETSDWKVSFDVNGYMVESQAVIANDTWFYIAAIRDAENDEIRLYLDLGEGLDMVSSLSVDSGAVESSEFKVGYRYWAGDTELYYGYVDNTRVSNMALSVNELLIPEPATIGLLSISGLAAIIRRRSNARMN